MVAGVYALGLANYYQGRQAAALDQFRHLYRLDPHSPSGWTVRHMTARCLYDLGRHEEALLWANRAVTAPHAKTIAFALQAAAAARTGRISLAQDIIADVIRRDPMMTVSYVIGTFGNEFLTDAIEALAEQLGALGLSD